MGPPEILTGISSVVQIGQAGLEELRVRHDKEATFYTVSPCEPGLL